jgi:zinc D-Ala-D-Ala carboxypeptidase
VTISQYRELWEKLGLPADVAARAAQRLHPEARRLVLIGRAKDDGRILRLAPAAAKAWRRMQAAAATDGITLLPLSAYRSVARQTLIIRRKLAAGQRITEILRVSAVPGCSEHHTGRALDLGAPGHLKLEVSFARTREFRWLKGHAARFGFHLSYPRGNRQGIAYEPWHWCYTNYTRYSPAIAYTNN